MRMYLTHDGWSAMHDDVLFSGALARVADTRAARPDTPPDAQVRGLAEGFAAAPPANAQRAAPARRAG